MFLPVSLPHRSRRHQRANYLPSRGPWSIKIPSPIHQSLLLSPSFSKFIEMSDATANIPPSFSRADIQLLVSGYSRGGLHQWGQVGLFSQVLGPVPNYNYTDKSIAVVAWELTELMGHVVCVVDPCSATPWFLRIVLTPDFVFLGLHWAGTDAPGKSCLSHLTLDLSS